MHYSFDRDVVYDELDLQEEHMLLCKKPGDLVTYEEIASCKYTTKVHMHHYEDQTMKISYITSFHLYIYRWWKK